MSRYAFVRRFLSSSYLPLQPESPVRRRLIFAFHLAACMCQLLMFTYSCDCIIQESSSIASAVYDGPWPFLFETTSGRTMRKDLTLVILRSAVPCCLTARGFFVVSLETYTRVSELLFLNQSFLKGDWYLEHFNIVNIGYIYLLICK